LKDGWQRLQPKTIFSISVNYAFQACAMNDPLAEEAVRKAISMVPDNAMLWDALGECVEEKYAREQEQLTIAYYSIAWALDHSMARPALRASSIYEDHGYFEESEEWARRAIQVS
jgi:hypothetical protein